MKRELGDALVREERLLRPSPSFSYLVTGEIPPESYPEFLIEEYRAEFRRACELHLVKTRRRDTVRKVPGGLWAFLLDSLIQVVLLNDRLKVASSRARWSGMAIAGGAPRSIAVLRSLS